MEFLKSQTGKQKLAFEGYMYICDIITENKKNWKCGSGLCRGQSKNFVLITDEFHNFRYEHLWNHDFYAQESNIIFDIFDIFFFSIFFRYYFDIFSILFRYFFDVLNVFFDSFLRLKVNSIFCLIRCVDV